MIAKIDFIATNFKWRYITAYLNELYAFSGADEI